MEIDCQEIAEYSGAAEVKSFPGHLGQKLRRSISRPANFITNPFPFFVSDAKEKISFNRLLHFQRKNNGVGRDMHWSTFPSVFQGYRITCMLLWGFSVPPL